MNLRIATTANYVKDEWTILPNRSVYLLAEDGRAMFEIRPDGDHSIEIRGIECCKVDGVLYGPGLSVIPHVTNSISIGTLPE